MEIIPRCDRGFLYQSELDMRFAPCLIALLLIMISPMSVAENLLGGSARKSLAVVSGRLTVAGLSSPVRILRDRWGVAHIYAQNKHRLPT